MKTLAILFSLVLAILLAPAAAHAASKAELQRRFKERYPQIQELKAAGVVGETDEGYLDFVSKKDPAVAKLIDEENRDRKELYKLIAQAEGIDPAVVATRAAKRNFEKAKPGEYLKEGGKWKKK
jgi:uncharacterized protein YdbL (DUF1318 family)